MKRSNLRISEIIFTSRQLSFNRLVFMDLLPPSQFRLNDFSQLPLVLMIALPEAPFCHSIFCVSSSHRKFEWIYSRFSPFFVSRSMKAKPSHNLMRAITFLSTLFHSIHSPAAVSSLLESFCFVAFNGVSWKMFSMPSLFSFSRVRGWKCNLNLIWKDPNNCCDKIY